MPRHETLNTAIKSCTWVSEWKIQKDKTPPSISVLYNHSPSIQHSPEEQLWLSMLKYRCCNISLHPSMDKSQLRTDHIKGRNGDWVCCTGSKKPILQKLFGRWAGPRQFRSKWAQRHSCPSLCSQCHVHTPSSHKDALITHSRVDLSETHLFLAGSELTAAPALILGQHTQKTGGRKVLVSGVGRGNRSRTMRALL